MFYRPKKTPRLASLGDILREQTAILGAVTMKASDSEITEASGSESIAYDDSCGGNAEMYDYDIDDCDVTFGRVVK